ncbi:MAG: O-antigen ligase protein [Tardiphaga sp.]|nr:O-antigen ligase protein [Tardiphaga sp.]
MILDKLRLLGTRNLISSWILFFVIAWAPFPFGSTGPTAIAFWCLLLAIAVTLLSTSELSRGQRWMIAGLLVIVAGYAFVLHEQLADRPWVAPFHPIWKKASEILGEPLTPSVSIVRNGPIFALGATLANVMALLVGLVIGSDRMRSRQIMLVIATSGALYALYGVLSFLIEPGLLLWRDKKFYTSSVTGTFINRNSAATYFGSCALLWLLDLTYQVRRRIPHRRINWQRVIRDFPKFSAREILPPSGALLICLVALLMTGSRAGVALSLLTMIVAFTIFLKKDLPPRTGIWISLGFGVVLAFGLLQLFGERVSSRFDSQGLVDEGRIEAWKSSLRIIADYPWFGTGLGTFAQAFPPYRSPLISVRGIWDRAHSSPLELACDVGLPLAILVAAGWGVMQFILLRGCIARRRGGMMLPLAALAISALSLSHSSIDFTLQIPGYTIPFFALFGAGLSQAWIGEARRDVEESYQIGTPEPG